ncbi:MAG: ParA family protein [Actinomycetota bacterium]|jgi:chromosome partitioning protein
MARVFAFANQKGGVAKTTSALSLGAALAEEGYRVLLVDLDPQASLTYSLGVDPDHLESSVHDVLLGRIPLRKIIQEADESDLAPSNIELAGAEVFLLTKTGREYELQRALDEVTHDYDAVLIDCPPSLGILTINGLTAAHEVIIPFQCEALSQRGVRQLIDTINDVRLYTNRGLKIKGILPTMFDPRTNHARRVLEEVASRYAIPIFEPPIRKSIRFAEAPAQGRSILKTAPDLPGAQAYREIAKTLL